MSVLAKAKQKWKQILALIVVICVYLAGYEELNLLTSPYVWADKHWREIMPYVYMWSTDYFAYLSIAIFFAFICMFWVGYFWKD